MERISTVCIRGGDGYGIDWKCAREADDMEAHVGDGGGGRPSWKRVEYSREMEERLPAASSSLDCFGIAEPLVVIRALE